MSIKSQSIGALFLALVLILGLNPKIINNIYDNILGRIFLICVVIFFSINSVTLGLLVVLIIIIASNQFGSFTEGFEQKEQAKEQLNEKKIKEEKAEEPPGVNLQDLKTTIMSKDSNTILVDKNMNRSEEVDPSTESMLKSNLKESFTLFGSNY